MKNSMEFLNSTDQNEEVWMAVREIHELSSTSDGNKIECLALEDRKNDNNARHIRRMLNYYEAMAVCVSHGIYDDRILREMLFSTVTRLWKQTLPYVSKRRDLLGKKTYFQEIEALVVRWEKKGLKDKNKKKLFP